MWANGYCGVLVRGRGADIVDDVLLHILGNVYIERGAWRTLQMSLMADLRFDVLAHAGVHERFSNSGNK